MNQVEILISRSRFRKYIPSLKIERDDDIVDYEIHKLFEFLKLLQTSM